MKYIIIGLGSYGQVLAKELTALHHEVIGVDINPSNVELLKDSIATSFILDATNEPSLSILPLRTVDAVIVAIGEALGASIKTVALLKKSQVNKIYARAIDSVHHSILEAFNIDLILNPEQDAARALVNQLDLHINIESMQLDNEYYIMKFKVPKALVGLKVKELSLEETFNLKLLTLIGGEKRVNCLGVIVSDKTVVESIDEDHKLRGSDYLVCYGKYNNFIKFWRTI